MEVAMHQTWYDVEREMLREIHQSASFHAEDLPKRGMDLPCFACVVGILAFLLVVIIPVAI